MIKVPILLITYNRPRHTEQVLSAILKCAPTSLYIFQDGCKDKSADGEKCLEVRSIIQQLLEGSNISIHTCYSDCNLGCGKGPVEAITWFFSHVSKGVILEDDCLPSPDFWPYCEELLAKYESDNQVSFIGGCNFGNNLTDSYSFGSGHHQTWGWATWKRTWDSYDYYLADISRNTFKNIIKYYYHSRRQQDYWIDIFDSVKQNRLNDSCWDYQFYFGNWAKYRLAIYPRVNLVTNVGYGEDATHTKSNNPLLNRECNHILPLAHPQHVQINHRLDYFLMRYYIIPYEYGLKGLKHFPYRLNKRLKRLVGHTGPWLKKK